MNLLAFLIFAVSTSDAKTDSDRMAKQFTKPTITVLERRTFMASVTFTQRSTETVHAADPQSTWK